MFSNVHPPVGFCEKCPFNHNMNGGYNREQNRARSPRSRELQGSDVTFLNRAAAVELSPKPETSRSPPTAQLLMNAGRGEPP